MPRIRGIAILDYPPLAGSIPTPSPWINTWTTTCTTNGTTGLTAIPAAVWANLNLGQPVSPAAGVFAINTYITALPSSGTATLSTAALNSTSGQAITFGLYNPSQSPNPAIGPGWNGPPLPPLYSQSNVFIDVNGCLLEVPNLVTLAAAATYVIPPGEGLLIMVSGGTQAPVYQVFQGTASPAWTALVTGSTTGATVTPTYYMSDGANFRVLNTSGAAGSATFTFYQWR
jgi:hypothetical protein